MGSKLSTGTVLELFGRAFIAAWFNCLFEDQAEYEESTLTS